MDEPSGTVMAILLILSLLALLAGAMLRWPPRDHLLVVSRRGVVRRVVGGGPTWRWPLLDSVEAVPLVPEPLTVSVRATTRDGHDVRLLAEASRTASAPRPGDPADAVALARVAAEAELEEELTRAVALRGVAELEQVEVPGLEVAGVDVVLRPSS